MAEKLTIVVDLDSGAVKTGMEDTERIVKKSGRNLRKEFNDLGKVAGVAMLGFGVAAVKSASEAETSFAKLRTIAGKETDKLKKQIMGLPPELGNVAGAAEAAYQAISASVEPAKAIDFVRQAALAAKGGFTDMTTAVDAGTTILNSYGAAAGTSTQIFDKFLKAQNLGKTTFGEMANSIGDVAATAKDFGIPFDNLLGMIAQLTASGIQTPKAITGIRAAISNLAKPTKDATDEFAALGLTIDDVKRMGIVGLIEAVKTRSKDAGQSFTNIFGSVEAATAIKTMAGNLDATKEKIAGIAGASGDAASAAEIMMGTTGEQFAALGVSLNKIMITVGEQFLPMLKELTAAISSEMGTIKTVAQGVGSTISTIVKGLQSIRGGVGALGTAAGELSTGNAQGAIDAIFGSGGVDMDKRATLAPEFAGPAPAAPQPEFVPKFGGFFADGGRPPVGKVSIVGENGPEPFIPDSAGTILPNSVLTGGLGMEGDPNERIMALRERIRAVFAQGAEEGVADGAASGMGSPTGTGAAGKIFAGTSQGFMSAIMKGSKDGSVIDAVGNFAKGLGEQVKEQLKQALVSSLGKKLLGGIFGGGFGGFFAEGGRPPVGVPSIVGERGPEVFVPDQPGTVLPSGTGIGGLSLTIGTLVVGAGATPELASQTVQQIVDELSDRLERGELPGFARRVVEAAA